MSPAIILPDEVKGGEEKINCGEKNGN